MKIGAHRWALLFAFATFAACAQREVRVPCASDDQCPGGGFCVDGVCKPTCTPETDVELCTRDGRTCGAYETTDRCRTSRSIASCGACNAPLACGAAGTCACAVQPETDEELCLSAGATCGMVSIERDRCGVARTVASCGACTMPAVCGGAAEAGSCDVACACSEPCTTAPELEGLCVERHRATQIGAGSYVVTWDESGLYWCDYFSGFIEYLPRNDTAPEVRTSSIATPHPGQLAVDPNHEYIYWTSVGANERPIAQPGSVWRARRNGDVLENPERLFGISSPIGIAVDDTHLYVGGYSWTPGQAVILAIRVDSLPSQIVTTTIARDLLGPISMAIDPSNDVIYFSEYGPPARIGRMRKDGSEKRILFEEPEGTGLLGVGLDGAHIYSNLAGRFFRIPREGGRATTIHVDDAGGFAGISLDRSASVLYYGTMVAIRRITPRAPPGDDCMSALALPKLAGSRGVIEERIDTSSTAISSDYAEACLNRPTPGKDVVFALELDARARLSVAVDPAEDIHYQIRWGADCSLLNCGPVTPTLDPGTYFLVVDSATTADVVRRLTVRLEDPPAP